MTDEEARDRRRAQEIASGLALGAALTYEKENPQRCPVKGWCPLCRLAFEITRGGALRIRPEG